MINCPNCNASLPDWAQKCQFCGTDTAKVVRPVVQKTKQKIAAFETPVWVNVAYYSIAGWFILSALIAAAANVISISSAKSDSSAADYVGLVFCLIQVLIGLGLILKINIVRGIVNFFCGLQILKGVLFGLGAFPLMMLSPVAGILWLLYQLFDIATAVFMIYLIGETDAGTYI